MLERLMSFWKGKIFVLVLLGFAATDFIITMTLSAADATPHLVENPHLEPFLGGHQVVITLLLLALLGAVFLRGFKESHWCRGDFGGDLPCTEHRRHSRRSQARCRRAFPLVGLVGGTDPTAWQPACGGWHRAGWSSRSWRWACPASRLVWR
jgi:hypothetical protein